MREHEACVAFERAYTSEFVSVRDLNSSVKEHLVDALAVRGDEGRGTLR